MHGEFWRRIAFTLAALFVWRLGQFIPVPGLHTQTLPLNGAMARVSILALSLAAYVQAAILLQLVAIVWPRLRALRDAGERGRTILVRWTRILTAVLTALQGIAIAGALERIPGAVPEPGPLFVLTTAATLVAGVLFLTWLADQITAHGIGNGIALLLIASILADVVRDLLALLEASREGLIPGAKLTAMAFIGLAFTVVAVTAERARRRIRVQFAERQIGEQRLEHRSVELVFKLNPGGIVPALFGPWILLIVAIMAQLATWAFGLGSGAMDWLTGLTDGRPAHLAVAAVITILFAFVYTAFLHDPERLARQLDAQGGTIAELAPGTSAVDYLDDTLSRLTALGAVYLAAIMLLPTALAYWLGVPFAIGGAALLIVVCLTLDIEAQVRALWSR
jgi:preprotein translocase subunit SecY